MGRGGEEDRRYGRGASYGRLMGEVMGAELCRQRRGLGECHAWMHRDVLHTESLSG